MKATEGDEKSRSLFVNRVIQGDTIYRFEAYIIGLVGRTVVMIVYTHPDQMGNVRDFYYIAPVPSTKEAWRIALHEEEEWAQDFGGIDVYKEE